MLGLAIGLTGFSVMAAFGVLEARSLGGSTSQIIGWTPWLSIFVLANGFFEDLMARGVISEDIRAAGRLSPREHCLRMFVTNQRPYG